MAWRAKEMESRRLADLDEDGILAAEEHQHRTVTSSPAGSAIHNIQILEPSIATDEVHDRRRSVAAERAVARSFIVRDCRRYSLVSKHGTVRIPPFTSLPSTRYVMHMHDSV